MPDNYSNNRGNFKELSQQARRETREKDRETLPFKSVWERYMIIIII